MNFLFERYKDVAIPTAKTLRLMIEKDGFKFTQREVTTLYVLIDKYQIEKYGGKKLSGKGFWYNDDYPKRKERIKSRKKAQKRQLRKEN